MKCSCIDKRRYPEMETNGGKLPIPLHSPRCEEYRLETFYKVFIAGEVDLGGSYIVESESEAKESVRQEEDYLAYEEIKLTRDQFENLEEFDEF